MDNICFRNVKLENIPDPGGIEAVPDFMMFQMFNNNDNDKNKRFKMLYVM